MKNKKLTLLFFLLCFCFITNQSSAQLAKAFDVKGPYFNPWYIHAVDNDRLIVFDSKNEKKALQLRRVSNGQIIKAHRLGKGPGELSGVGPKIINQNATGGISVWDSNAKQMLIYDEDLNYHSSIFIKKLSINVALTDNKMVYITNAVPEGPFLQLFNSTKNGLSSEPVQTYSADKYPALKPLAENFMLRQGPFVTDGENLFIGFSYSSIILKATPKSLLLFDEAPNAVSLPEYDFTRNRNGQKMYVAPSINSFPKGTLGMALDDNFLYALFSGKKFEGTSEQQKKWKKEGTLAERYEDLNYSTQILLYDKKTGEYLHTITLPEKAKKIGISESYIFALSLDEQGLPIITAYNKETGS